MRMLQSACYRWRADNNDVCFEAVRWDELDSIYTFSGSIFLMLHWFLPDIFSGVTCINLYRSACMTTD